MEELKIYTVEQVAELLKVTRHTVYRYIKDGALKPVKKGKQWYFSEATIRDYFGGLE